MLKGLIGLLATVVAASSANAAYVVLPSSLDVQATSSTGTSVTLANVKGSDILSFSVSGQPTLQSPGLYGTNAAGVVTLAGTSPVGGSSIDPDTGNSFGALDLSFNGGSLIQVFATNAMNGLGSANPPTDFSYSGTLAALFGLDANSLYSGTLTFSVDDQSFFRSDNAGGFTIVSDAPMPAVPEPSVWASMIAGLAMVGTALRRRRLIVA